MPIPSGGGGTGGGGAPFSGFPATSTYPGPDFYPGGIEPGPPPPPPTTVEVFTVDGVIMNTYAKSPTNMLGLLRAPGKRNNNVTVPGRHGVLRTTSKFYDESIVTLPFWVQGRSDDGRIPTGSTARIEFQQRIEELVSLFTRMGKQLDVRITRADATVRQAYAEVLDVLDFTTGANWRDPYAQFVVTLTIGDPFWQDVDPTIQTLAPPTFGAINPLTSFNGTTAPIVDSVLTFHGPWVNPYVEAYVNGAPMERPTWVRINANIADGKFVTLNCGTWSVSGPAAVPYASVVHGGSSRFLEIQPSSFLGTPQLYISGSGAGAHTALDINARRKYLVG